MIAIVGGTIYTPDELIEQGVVLIDGGKIRAVDVAARLDVPEEAQIIEATSRGMWFRGTLMCTPTASRVMTSWGRDWHRRSHATPSTA